MRDVSRNTADILELYEIFWRNYTMTKIELLRQYIGDLKMHVPESQGRDNRIAVLEEELEHEQLQNTSSNSDYAAAVKNLINSEVDCVQTKNGAYVNLDGVIDCINHALHGFA